MKRILKHTLHTMCTYLGDFYEVRGPLCSQDINARGETSDHFDAEAYRD